MSGRVGGPRRGMALMMLVVALAILSVMMSATTWEIVAQRRAVQQRHYQEQARWLARAGIERAAARLLAEPPGDAGASIELIPQAELRVTVRREPGKNDTYRIVSESRYPTDVAHPVVRTETRQLRRSVEGAVVRLTILQHGE